MRLLVFLFCTLPFLAKAQTELYGMHSRWSDSFGEWYLASPVERQAGTLDANTLWVTTGPNGGCDGIGESVEGLPSYRT